MLTEDFVSEENVSCSCTCHSNRASRIVDCLLSAVSTDFGSLFVFFDLVSLVAIYGVVLSFLSLSAC